MYLVKIKKLLLINLLLSLNYNKIEKLHKIILLNYKIKKNKILRKDKEEKQ
jgi:hypothetical protein